MMLIDNKFNIKDIVYSVIDEDQEPRFVNSITVSEGVLLYNTSTANGNTVTYEEYEISTEKTVVL